MQRKGKEIKCHTCHILLILCNFKVSCDCWCWSLSSDLKGLSSFLTVNLILLLLSFSLLALCKAITMYGQLQGGEECLFSFLSIGTIMQFAKTDTHGRVTFSPPLIYSWTHRIINVCFIIWATIQKVFCLFWCSNFFVSDIESSFNRLCLS